MNSQPLKTGIQSTISLVQLIYRTLFRCCGRKLIKTRTPPCLPAVTPDLLCCPGIHDHTASIHPAIGPTPPGSSQLSFPPASGSSCKSRVGVGVQKKRGVHAPHTPFFPLPDLPFFPLPTSLPLHYVKECSAPLYTLSQMTFLAWPLLGTQGTDYQFPCHPQGWGRLPQAPALNSQHIPCVYEPILGLR